MRLSGERLTDFDYFRQLRRGRTITAAEYAKAKRLLERAEEQHQQILRLKREEAIIEKRRAKQAAEKKAKLQKQREKREESSIFNKIRRSKTTVLSLTEVDSKIGFEKFVRFLNSLKDNYTMKIGNTTWVFNDSTRHRLLRLVKDVILEDAELHEDSWGAMVKIAKDIGDTITISKFQSSHRYTKHQGAFFKYTHNTVFDFSRYGVFKTGETQNHEDTCLIVALRNGGLEQDKIDMIKLFIRNRIIPRCKLKDICDKLKITIILFSPGSSCKNSKKVFGTSDRAFHIGIIDEHYFIIEPTQLTSYCLAHYDEVKEEKNFHQIIGVNNKGSYKRDEKRFIDSFDVITTLLKNSKLLKEISMEDRVLASTQFYDSISDKIGSLEYESKDCIRPITFKKWNNKKELEYENLFFDFETYTKDGLHIPYLVRTWNEKTNAVFHGVDCGLYMLRSLKKNTRLIAHNANYDYRFLIDYVWNVNELSRGTRLIGFNASFGSKEKFIHIEIKDSYHLISKPLRDFPKTFGLDSIKEVMPYNLYSEETIAKRYIDIDYVLQNFIAEKDREQFLNNIERWNLKKDNTYDIIEYSSKYCELDCIILGKGYSIFRKMMLDCVKLDIDKILTIASLAHQYFISQGCYEGVNQLGGVPQLFIQGTVVGGRTMVANNEKIMIEEDINDFDAVSLYPSAMSRIPGFLKGSPKVITNTSYDDLKTKDGYFVDIVIKSIAIPRDFSLVSYKDDNHVRQFTNNMIGKTIRVDKITLEDLIEFQGVDFDIVRGYYFDEGFNTKIRETIKYVFEERLKQKKLGNPSQEIYKLIMNSGYGKSIMKPVGTESRFFDSRDDANVFISRNYNWIESFVEFGTKTKVNSVKPLIDHYNIAHVGTTILSMSKRIMNEVMCLAEDNKLKLYYQDTDSIHIKDKDISTLSSAFMDKYGRELIGKNMGQFHSDFDLKGCKNVYARRSLFLGKKMYIDELVGTNDDGEQVIGHHIRMKGIPESVLMHTCDKLGYKSPMDLYAALYHGASIEFDLTNDGRKANFKMGSDYKVHTLSLFKRTISLK